APGQRRRRAIREVVNPGEEAADAADRDADRERKRKSRAGPAHDAGVALVELDRDDAPSDGGFNRAREPGLPPQPGRGRAQAGGWRSRTRRRRRRRRTGAPPHKPARATASGGTVPRDAG